MGAPRSGTRLMRKLGAGVTVSCTGVLEPEPEPLREMRNLGFLFSGELTSFCASSAVVNALSFMGWGISSSELSPMSMFCIMGALAEKPCDCPRTDNGESLLGRIVECERMRPCEEPPRGVGEAMAIATRAGRVLCASLQARGVDLLASECLEYRQLRKHKGRGVCSCSS